MKKMIVIGGGILGASTAYHLAVRGFQVTVVDRKDQGQATGAAAGIICPWLSQRRNKAWYALVREGAAYYRELIPMLNEAGESDHGFKQTGAICLHDDPVKRDKMLKRALQKREEAPEIGELTPVSNEEINRYFPYLTDEYAGLYVEGAARVDGAKLRDSLLSAAVKSGARILEGQADLAIEQGSMKGVHVSGQFISADMVIVTAGAWAKELFSAAGIEIDVSYQKAQILHLKVEDQTDHWPVVIPPGDQYLLAFDDGRLVAGATHENDVPMDDRLTVSGIREVFDKATLIAPALEEAEFIEGRVGYRPFTPGFLPVIGEFPGIKNLLFANGLGASGLTSGPFLGAELARLAAGEETVLDLSPYTPESILK
ncbi:FAD-binding oxidoreductase [Jeotgalibacillus sp. R-1-5s-1]|uniref:NAD(P)/FAD-dependent oxidoreductase n=1 Tax=Jeotgalibacillus sp. R-1-5s-1 TaxID=2555897 RepID=UPI00106C55A1|nr:FAD-binding oxidoreductase [Jeotgalibacillus sp. R-1-5s-1]TFD97570.1 FAD-binding oxidoreductase [Jeotgalibacillus sp. R-1-5s-1]